MKQLYTFCIATLFCISIGKAQVWKVNTTTNGLPNNSIRCLSKDLTGNLWIGTQGGISMYDGTSFTNYTVQQGLPNNYIRSITCDNSGTIWIGTQAGLSETNGSGFINYNTSNGLPSNVITALTPGTGGDLWVGTGSSGISKLNGTTFTNYNTTDGLINNSITSMCSDLLGNIWIGTNGGISVFDGFNFTNYNTGNGLPINNIKVLFCDSSGNIWIGTPSGLVKYSFGVFSTLTTTNGLLSNIITAIFEDDLGNIWIGYNVYGLSKYNGSSFTSFDRFNGYIWNNTTTIMHNNNYIYSGCGSGLITFKKWIIPPYRFDYLDTNNIAAGINSNGLLFEKPDNTGGGFLVPKQTGASSLFASSVWFGGFDQNNLLHLSAMRFLYLSNDITTGPLFADMNTYDDDSTWNRIWKISKTEIDNHILNYNQSGYIIPLSISEWPAPTADYVDVNANNLYDPQNGDYPLIRGDQAILTIYNDLNSLHQSGGLPLGIEVHSLSYSFNSTDSALANTVFNNYKIYNYSSNNYSDFYIGIYSDIDVGNAVDDYIGCDSTNSLYFCYNGTATDSDYGTNIPAQGVVFLSSNMYSFNYFNNNVGIMGDPIYSTEYYNVLNGYWKDGTPYTYGGTGYGGTIYTNYCFSDDPNNPAGWSEVTENNTPGDRRGVGTVGPFTLLTGKALCMDVAFPNAISYTGNNLNSVPILKERTSQIINFYNTQNWDCGEIFTDTNTVPHLYSQDAFACKGIPYQTNNIVVGGAPPYTYSWSPSTGLSSDTVLNPTITITNNMQYVLTVTDHHNNITIDTINFYSSSPNIFAGYDTTVCNNETVILTASPGGYVNYNWSCCGWTQSINVNTGHNSAGTVNYIIMVYDSLGCSNKDTVAVTYLPSPDVNFGLDRNLCNTESLLLDAGIGADNYLWNTGATSSSILVDGTVLPLGINTFNVHAWNNNNCHSYDTISLTLLTTPIINIGIDTLLCNTEILLLDAGTGADNYLWSTGATSYSILVDGSILPLGNNSFFVHAWNNNNCHSYDTINVDVQICSNIEELARNGFKVYPNPSEGIFFIESSQDYTLKITEIKGDIILQKQFTKGTEKFMLTELSKGIYILEIITNQNNIKTKLILD